MRIMQLTPPFIHVCYSSSAPSCLFTRHAHLSLSYNRQCNRNPGNSKKLTLYNVVFIPKFVFVFWILTFTKLKKTETNPERKEKEKKRKNAASLSRHSNFLSSGFISFHFIAYQFNITVYAVTSPDRLIHIL